MDEVWGYRAKPCAELVERGVAFRKYFGRRPKGVVVDEDFFYFKEIWGGTPLCPPLEVGLEWGGR
jgi:hypothetical protein